MTFQLLIAVGAGALSAVLFSSVTTGSLVALPLFYLSPLPNYVAGLGWGPYTALLTMVCGMFVVAPILGVKAALMHAMVVGIPVWIICYLLSLNREISRDSVDNRPQNLSMHGSVRPENASDSAGVKEIATSGTGNFIEWYNIGNVITVMAYIAGLLSVIGIFLIGSDIQSYRDEIKIVLERAFQSSSVGDHTPRMDPKILDAIVRLVPEVLPASSATIWLMTNLIILWVAGLITRSIGNLMRPWPDIANMDYPRSFGFAFIAALALSFLPGLTGLASTSFIGAIITAYLIMGLSVIHVLCRKSQFKVYFLIMIYFSLIIFPWLIIIIAIVGVGEPIFRLRER